MPKVTQVPCPTPGCGRLLDVKLTGRGRPSVSCKLSAGGCGWSGFVNAKKGVAMWAGESAAAAIAAEPPAARTPEKPKVTLPAATAAEAPEGGKGGFKWPWQE